MTRAPGPDAGKRLLFWDELAGDIQPLLGLLGVVPRGCGHGQPKDHVRHDVPWADREELSHALQFRTTMNPIGGDVLMSYMGWANCRICGERLGTSDFFGHGFSPPAGIEIASTPHGDEHAAVEIRVVIRENDGSYRQHMVLVRRDALPFLIDALERHRLDSASDP